MQKVVLISCILLIFVSGLSFAGVNYQDVVYLKNGTIIRGVIIEQIPDKSLKIKTKDGNIFVFDYDDIKKITKESEPKKVRSKKPTGYANISQVGMHVSEGSTKLNLTTINAVQLTNSNMSLGIGVGYVDYPGGTLIPIYADARFYLPLEIVFPLIYVQGGYSIGFVDGASGSDWGGKMFSIGGGLRVPIDKNQIVGPMIQVGYRLQQLKTYYITFSGRDILLHKTWKSYHELVISAGVSVMLF